MVAFSDGKPDSSFPENAPMTATNSAGRPFLQSMAGPFSFAPHAVPTAVGTIAVAAGLLAIAPLVSLIVIAFGDTGDLWTHLSRYVIPTALGRTTLLLAGVAAVTIIVGAGTAWIVTTFAFPGRDALTWLLPLPLAIPDLYRGLRLRRHSRRGRTRAGGLARDLRLALRGRLLVSERPLAHRRHPSVRLRALPLRLSRHARDAADARLDVHRGSAHARRASMGPGAAHHLAAGAARARCRRLARPARDPQ